MAPDRTGSFEKWVKKKVGVGGVGVERDPEGDPGGSLSSLPSWSSEKPRRSPTVP